MSNVKSLAAVLLFAVISAGALAQSAPPAFEKKNYNYSEWTKGRFSEVVTVTGPGKMIFLAGVGSEDEEDDRRDPAPLRFRGQCRYAYDKIKRILAQHGATLADMVKLITYVTDIRLQRDLAPAAASSTATSRARPIPFSTSTSSPGPTCWSRSTSSRW